MDAALCRPLRVKLATVGRATFAPRQLRQSAPNRSLRGLTDKRLVDSVGKELVQFWRTYADPQERHNSRGDTLRGR
jgi:hypothetical protein